MTFFNRARGVTAGFPAETYLGSRMRGGGLFERWPRGHRVKTSVMSRFPWFFRSVLVQIVSVFPESYRCNIVASLWVVLMVFRGLNVQFKVDLYMVCHRSQLQGVIQKRYTVTKAFFALKGENWYYLKYNYCYRPLRRECGFARIDELENGLYHAGNARAHVSYMLCSTTRKST